MLVPNRNFQSPAYRYGFQGQEKDDEISGLGNNYTAEFWEYDSRIGRRWNIDPVVKAYESPYVSFRNNPILFADTDGLNGIVTVDKKNKKVTVKAKVYYNKNSKDLKRFAIHEDYKTKRGETIKSLFSKILDSDGKMSSSHKITDEDGVDWTVDIIIEFIAKENDNEVEQALKKDPTSNKMIYSNELRGNAAQWSFSKRAIEIGNQPAEAIFKHELGHSLGLPHSVFIPGSSLFGNMETPSGNGAGLSVENDDAGLMSYYNNELKLRKREVSFMVMNAINLSKTVNNNLVNVFLSGWVYKNVPMEQIEKQTPFTDPVKFKKKMDNYRRVKNNPKNKYHDKIMD